MTILRVTNRFFGIRDFPYLNLGIRDLKAKSGRDSGLKVCARGEMPKITLGITGLHEILGRDYGIGEPYWGPSILWDIPQYRHRQTHCETKAYRPEIVIKNKQGKSCVLLDMSIPTEKLSKYSERMWGMKATTIPRRSGSKRNPGTNKERVGEIYPTNLSRIRSSGMTYGRIRSHYLEHLTSSRLKLC